MADNRVGKTKTPVRRALLIQPSTMISTRGQAWFLFARLATSIMLSRFMFHWGSRSEQLILCFVNSWKR